MRDISPSERKVLEKVSETVAVFERLPQGKTDVEWDPGHFVGCDCGVGVLSSDRKYRSFILYLNSNTDSQQIGFTVSFSDRFFIRRAHWISNLVSKNAPHWPKYDVIYVEESSIEENPNIYVRLLWDSVDGEVLHVNKKINLLERIEYLGMTVDDISSMGVMPGGYYGVYIEPTVYSIGGSITPSVRLEGVRFMDVPMFDQTKSALSKAFQINEGVNLKPIVSSSSEKKSAKVGKKPKSPKVNFSSYSQQVEILYEDEFPL